MMRSPFEFPRVIRCGRAYTRRVVAVIEAAYVAGGARVSGCAMAQHAGTRCRSSFVAIARAISAAPVMLWNRLAFGLGTTPLKSRRDRTMTKTMGLTIQGPVVAAQTAVPPDFIGVGAQKCGTSWWYSLVAEHPMVHDPAGFNKEARFFCQPGPFDLAAYHALFARPSGRIAGEWTPDYLGAVLDRWSCCRSTAREDPVSRARSGPPLRLASTPADVRRADPPASASKDVSRRSVRPPGATLAAPVSARTGVRTSVRTMRSGSERRACADVRLPRA